MIHDNETQLPKLLPQFRRVERQISSKDSIFALKQRSKTPAGKHRSVHSAGPTTDTHEMPDPPPPLLAVGWDDLLPPRVGEHVLQHLNPLMWYCHLRSEKRDYVHRHCNQLGRKAVEGVACGGRDQPVLPAHLAHLSNDFVLLEHVEVRLASITSARKCRLVDSVGGVVVRKNAVLPELAKEPTLVHATEFLVAEAQLDTLGPRQGPLVLQGAPERVVAEVAREAQ